MVCNVCNGTGKYGPGGGYGELSANLCYNCQGTGEDDIYEAVMHYRKDHPEPKQKIKINWDFLNGFIIGCATATTIFVIVFLLLP